MDFLFFDAGECDDAMRDRVFYLVKDVQDEDHARIKLTEHFTDTSSWKYSEDYAVFAKGTNMCDGATGPHTCYRMYTL